MTVKFTARGNIEELKALYNALNACKDCKSVRTEMLHKDRELTTGLQTFIVEMTPATRYHERAEKPERDRSGWCYLFETSLPFEAPYVGIYKLGHSKVLDDRKALFNVKLPFAVKLIHNFHCHDRIAVERELKRRYAKLRLSGSEFLKLTADGLADICSM